MATDLIAAGWYPEMTNRAYHEAAAVSKSRLDFYHDKSPRHYEARFITMTADPEKTTEAKIIGDACHAAILEPDTFEQRYVVPHADAPRRPSVSQVEAAKPSPGTLSQIKFWRDFDEEHAGKVILRQEHRDIAMRTRDSVRGHPRAAELLIDGVAEHSFFAQDPITGLMLKVRPDYLRLNSGMIVDLKSTLCANAAEFGRSAENYRYHVQGSFYCDVLDLHFLGDFATDPVSPVIEHFVFIAFEKDPPYAVGIYWMTPEDFEDGRFEYRRDLDALASHVRAGSWPDEGMEPKPLQRPYWAEGNRRRKEAAFAARRY